MFKTLVKANDSTISFCTCSPAYATSGQADCPWCGCGWLFTCIDCRKAFTFAKVVETEFSPEELAERDFLRFGVKPELIDRQAVAAKADWLASEIEDLPLDTICILLDGRVIAAEARDVEITGWFATHAFHVAPHVAVAGDGKKLDAILGDKTYWFQRERDDRDV